MPKFTAAAVVPSEITTSEVFFNRRALLAAALAAGAGAVLPALAAPQPAAGARNYPRNARFSVNEAPNSFEDITGYNNYYEFGTDKADPKANAQSFRTKPWTVVVDGEAEVKGTLRA